MFHGKPGLASLCFWLKVHARQAKLLAVDLQEIAGRDAVGARHEACLLEQSVEVHLLELLVYLVRLLVVFLVLEVEVVVDVIP